VQARAGIEHADALVACTPGDNRNIAASQIAREIFHVPKVVARINDPLRAEVFHELGLQTISPTLLGTELVREALLRRQPA
jgi:trk system potassium uptake protein TrkA